MRSSLTLVALGLFVASASAAIPGQRRQFEDLPACAQDCVAVLDCETDQFNNCVSTSGCSATDAQAAIQFGDVWCNGEPEASGTETTPTGTGTDTGSMTIPEGTGSLPTSDLSTTGVTTPTVTPTTRSSVTVPTTSRSVPPSVSRPVSSANPSASASPSQTPGAALPLAVIDARTMVGVGISFIFAALGATMVA